MQGWNYWCAPLCPDSFSRRRNWKSCQEIQVIGNTRNWQCNPGQNLAVLLNVRVQLYLLFISFTLFVHSWVILGVWLVFFCSFPLNSFQGISVSMSLSVNSDYQIWYSLLCMCPSVKTVPFALRSERVISGRPTYYQCTTCPLKKPPNHLLVRLWAVLKTKKFKGLFKVLLQAVCIN